MPVWTTDTHFSNAVDMAVEEIKRLRFALEVAEGAHDVANDDYFELLKENRKLRKTIDEFNRRSGGIDEHSKNN